MSSSIDATAELREATRLAAAGRYKCRCCGRIAPQELGLVVALLGNVLLAVCPECITGSIVIQRTGEGQLKIEMPAPRQRRVIPVSDLCASNIRIAKPHVEKTKL